MKTLKKQIVLKITCITLMFISSITLAQTNSNKNLNQREGFLFEFVVGAKSVSIEDSKGVQTFDESHDALSFPEFKFGYMINNRLAITAVFPGMIYEYQNNDRHFGGLIPSVQYWVKDKWWINGGIGLAMDGPALYDIKKNTNDDWNFGCAVMASTGYEIYTKNSFVLNLQSKMVLGRAFLGGNDYRDAASFSIGLGFSWL